VEGAVLTKRDEAALRSGFASAQGPGGDRNLRGVGQVAAMDATRDRSNCSPTFTAAGARYDSVPAPLREVVRSI
jgi:hypothetical protein